jgi:hypothetical protein
MSSSESFHNTKGRALLRQGLLAANDHARVNARLHGQLTSHEAHGIAAGLEVLAHFGRVEAERAAAAAAAAPPAPKPKRKAATKPKVTRAKAAKRKPAAGRKARTRGR